MARSFQQLEVPLVTARRVQHDLHRARCGCGTVHVAARPEGVPGSAVSIGSNLRALAVYLAVFQHVPAERCAQLIADVTGAGVSAGFVHSCLARAASAIAGVVKLIKTLITAAYVAGFDETTLRCGPAGTRRFVLAAVTERYWLFFLGRRSLESFRDFGILPAFGGVVVSDRYANYFRKGWEHIAGVPRIPGPGNSTAQHPGRDLLEFCSGRQDDVLRFCHDTRVWPANNISGRGVRPVKTQQEISGRLTSEEATRDRLDIRSYIDTARKHGCNVMGVLRAVRTGTPWHPPDPAPA